MTEAAGPGRSDVVPIEHWVLHVDMDQFLAAVELLRRPELVGKPVIVGGDGDPTKRGVVSTASYEARQYGVGSGMALRIAARKCPDAVFLPVDRAAYDQASERVMATLRALEWGGRAVVLEVLGWDEAFLAAGPLPGGATERRGAQLGRGRPWAGAADELAAEDSSTDQARDTKSDTARADANDARADGPTPVVEAGQGSLPPVADPNPARPGPGPGKGAPGGPSPASPRAVPRAEAGGPAAAGAPAGEGTAPAGQVGAAAPAGTPAAGGLELEPAPAGEGQAEPGEDRAFDAPDPTAFAAHIRAEVLAATGLHCSVGIGDNKLRAKIATEFGKPRGSFVLTATNWFEVMGSRPTTALWGIGRKTAKRLSALGIETVEQLAASDARVLAAELGPTMGPWYHRLGRGVSDSEVSAAPWVPRAHGRETTFQEDLEDWERIAEEVRRLTRQVVEDIDREGRAAARVGLKLRYKPFFTVSRSLTLIEPSNDPEVLAERAVSLLDRVERDRPVRLLGVRLEMVPPDGGY
jgi:nucleotidyltransferase/DNA polymerase involved in DNA repair